MKGVNLKSGSHSVHNCTYHVQWCTKYRYKVLRQDWYKKEMEHIIRGVAVRHSMEIPEIAVCDEHVHCIVRADMKTPPSKNSAAAKGRQQPLLHAKASAVQTPLPKRTLLEQRQVLRHSRTQ